MGTCGTIFLREFGRAKLPGGPNMDKIVRTSSIDEAGETIFMHNSDLPFPQT